MISRLHRFHGYGSLSRAYKQGSSVRGQYFALRYLHNPRRKSYRLAIVVSRKVHKSAVVRNRIRRRLYEAFRLQLSNVTTPYDLVVTVYSDRVATLESADIRRAVTSCIKAARLR